MTENSKDIEMIMRRKMIQYLRQQLLKQIRETEKKTKEDIYVRIKPLLKNEAYKYLINLKNTKKNVADKIVRYIISGLYYGMIQYPVDKIVIEFLERKIEGRSGQIYIQRRGELKDLDKVLKGED